MLWDRLPDGAGLSPFQTPGFLTCFQSTMLSSVSGSSRLSILEVRRRQSSAPVLLLPLVRRRRGPVRIASFPDHGVADLCAPVLAGDTAVDANDAADIWSGIIRNLEGVDLVDLRNMPETIGGVSNPLAGTPGTVPANSSLMLDLTAQGEGAAWRRKRAYKQARIKWEKLQAAGVDLVEPACPAERGALLETLFRQRSERFQSLGRPDSCRRPGRQAFYRALAAQDGSDSLARILGLRRGSETVASLVLLEAGDVANPVLISIGTDEWQRFSPGIVLMYLAIRMAEARGTRLFCFGTGLQEYKFRFGGTFMPMRDLTLPLTSAGEYYLRLRNLKQKGRQLLAMEAQ